MSIKPPPIPVRPVNTPIKKPIKSGASTLIYSLDFLYLILKGSPCIQECWCNLNFLFLCTILTLAVS